MQTEALVAYANLSKIGLLMSDTTHFTHLCVRAGIRAQSVVAEVDIDEFAEACTQRETKSPENLRNCYSIPPAMRDLKGAKPLTVRRSPICCQQPGANYQPDRFLSVIISDVKEVGMANIWQTATCSRKFLAEMGAASYCLHPHRW